MKNKLNKRCRYCGHITPTITKTGFCSQGHRIAFNRMLKAN